MHMEDLLLNQIKPGKKAEIISSKGIGAVHRRLLDMGLVKGSIIEVRKIAPLGDPIEIRIRGYNLSLRKSEAEKIQVRRIK